jgi:hypothetical protein
LLSKPDKEHEMFDYSTIVGSSKDKNAPLDPNHSHFILVDNSQLNKYGGEIEFRGKLEQAIVSYSSEFNEFSNGYQTPIVVLVLEGGPNTLETGSLLISCFKRS